MKILQKLRAMFGLSTSSSTMLEALTSADMTTDSKPAVTFARPVRDDVADARRCDASDDLIRYLSHYNGHVREAALKRTAELSLPELLPAVLERLNDWVPAVRHCAWETLFTLFYALDARHVLRALPAVQHLSTSKRADHSANIAEFEHAAIRVLGSQRLLDELRNPDIRTARACYRLLARRHLVDPATLVRRVLPDSPDIIMASSAVDAIAGLPEQEQPALYRLALQSRHGSLRAIVLRKLLVEPNAANDALAKSMLIDLQDWVRLIASIYLGKRGIDSAAIYADTLRAPDSSNHVLRACLYGLGGLKDVRYLELVRTFTTHACARVQASAFFAWLYLAPGEKDEIARAALASPYRRARKLALTLMREHGAYLPPDVAMLAFKTHDDVALMLSLARSDTWLWLETIFTLERRSRRDKILRDRLGAELKTWLFTTAPTYAKPNDAQRALFQAVQTIDVLCDLAGQYQDRLRQQLHFELQVLVGREAQSLAKPNVQ